MPVMMYFAEPPSERESLTPLEEDARDVSNALPKKSPGFLIVTEEDLMGQDCGAPLPKTKFNTGGTPD